MLEMHAMETLSNLIQSHQPEDVQVAKTLKLLRETLEDPGAGAGMLENHEQIVVPTLVLPLCRGADPSALAQHAVCFAEQVRDKLPILFRDAELYLATVRDNRLIFLFGWRRPSRPN